VQRVEPQGVTNGVGTFVVESDRARDVRRELSQLVAQQRWGLLELRALELSLEDMFIRILAGEMHEAAPADEAAAAEAPTGTEVDHA
jgi:hypothetical protein